ncbi:LuxR C-terminal-related transcriptional regulator [Actinoplanes sp. NPDC000266]
MSSAPDDFPRDGGDLVRVVVRSADVLSREGLIGFLEASGEFEVLQESGMAGADVLVVCCDRLTSGVVALLRLSAARSGVPVVLVTRDLSEDELLAALQCRVVGVLPLAAVTPDRLVRSVLAAASGGGVLSPELVRALGKHFERLQCEVLGPQGQNAATLTPREVDVLRLMADGLDTGEIADALRYSERTVDNVVFSMTSRLNLRNRSHAVAYALRLGVI